MSACTDDPASASGIQDPTPTKPAKEVVETILQAALGDKRARFEQLAIELRTSTDGAPTTVMTDREGRVRVSDPGRGTHVVDGDRAFAVVDAKSSRPLEPAERDAVLRMRAIAHAAYFAPLRHATSVERIDAKSIRLDDDWTLQHDADTPVELASTAHGKVRWLELGRPPALRLPRRIAIDGIGERHVRVLGDKVKFEPAMFERPEDRKKQRPDLVIGGPEFPTKPVFRKIEECHWLCVADPGTWPARIAAIRQHGTLLHKGKQRSAGPPFLFEENDASFLVIPFVSKQEGTRYEASEGQEVRKADTRTAAVVYAPDGAAFDARITSGRRMLDEFVAGYERRAGGPLRVIVDIFNEPKLRSDSADERAAAARSMDVRLELPVRD